jgi:hypothetical protein
MIPSTQQLPETPISQRLIAAADRIGAPSWRDILRRHGVRPGRMSGLELAKMVIKLEGDGL